jgi:hypothetical protein
MLAYMMSKENCDMSEALTDDAVRSPVNTLQSNLGGSAPGYTAPTRISGPHAIVQTWSSRRALATVRMAEGKGSIVVYLTTGDAKISCRADSSTVVITQRYELVD